MKKISFQAKKKILQLSQLKHTDSHMENKECFMHKESGI